MRSDMHKVLVESPRGGQAWSRSFPRPAYDPESAPRKEGMRQRHTNRKWFGEHLGPLKRWLRSQVGRPWSDLRKELSTVVRVDNVVRAHIRLHLFQMVHENSCLVDGRIWVHSYGGPVPLASIRPSAREPVFYVDPISGLLLEHRRPTRQERASLVARLLGQRLLWITDEWLLRRIQNQWYDCRMKRLPIRSSSESNIPTAVQYDAAEDKFLGPIEATSLYGRPAICVHHRPLTRRELKRWGLSSSGTRPRAAFGSIGPPFQQRPNTSHAPAVR